MVRFFNPHGFVTFNLLTNISMTLAKVKGLAQLDYDVTNVFITFETEADQRRVLGELSVGFWQSHTNDRKAVPNDYLYDDKVLYVSEPDEPSTIRWEDMNVSIPQALKLMVFSFIMTWFSIAAVFVFIHYGTFRNLSTSSNLSAIST